MYGPAGYGIGATGERVSIGAGVRETITGSVSSNRIGGFGVTTIPAGKVGGLVGAGVGSGVVGTHSNRAGGARSLHAVSPATQS